MTEDEQLPDRLAELIRLRVDHLLVNGDSNIFSLVVSDAEKAVINEVLRQCNSNVSAAARSLGISRKTLREKVFHGKVNDPMQETSPGVLPIRRTQKPPAIENTLPDRSFSDDINAELTRSYVRINPTQLLVAIQNGKLKATRYDTSEGHDIFLFVGDAPFAKVRCLGRNRPAAAVSADGKYVDVLPSLGLLGGFSIKCSSRKTARTIAKALDDCLACGVPLLRSEANNAS